LVREAFWNIYKPGCDEHLVFHRLRDDPAFVKELDYIVESEQGIVAQIVYARGTLIGAEGQETPVLMFGPIAVDPDHQGQGLGRALIEFTLKKAQSMGYPAVLITGNPDYYKKFGFFPTRSTASSSRHRSSRRGPIFHDQDPRRGESRRTQGCIPSSKMLPDRSI
jgi:predicted N-acetyltransferase YhbS